MGDLRERTGGQTAVWGLLEEGGAGNRAVNCLNVDTSVLGSP